MYSSNYLDTGTYLQAAAAKPLADLSCVPLEAGRSQCSHHLLWLYGNHAE